jgi:hypothetical protein
MSSTFSTDLKIELIANGEQSGTWGTTTNDNFTNVFEDAIVGTGTPIFTTDADLTLTYTSTNTPQIARNLALNVISSVVGGLTATRSLIVPTIQKNYLIKNNTTGGQAILVKTAAGAGIIIPNGYKAFVYVNGTDVTQAVDYFPNITTVNATVAGGSINYTPIGNISPSTGGFTQVDIIAQGDLRLQDTTGGQYVALQAPGTVPASYTLTFPDTDGNLGQVLTTDGSGVLSWTSNGNGDVVGPASATANAVALFDSTTGKLIKNSVVTIADTTGNMTGVGTLAVAGDASFNSTGAIKVPVGSTAQQPAGANGKIRYNTDYNQYQGYSAGQWTQIGGGATGGGGDQVFVENGVTVTTNYTLSTNKNAESVGPISINSGATVTIPDGQRWMIL